MDARVKNVHAQYQQALHEVLEPLAPQLLELNAEISDASRQYQDAVQTLPGAQSVVLRAMVSPLNAQRGHQRRR